VRPASDVLAAKQHGADPVHNSICGLIGLVLGLMIDGTLLVIRSSYRDGDQAKAEKSSSVKVKAEQKKLK